MFRRFPRECSSLRYLERPGKSSAHFMEKWRFSAGRRNFSFQPELPHIFDHNRPEYDESMSLDVVDSALKMAATKPQLEITFGRKLIAT